MVKRGRPRSPDSLQPSSASVEIFVLVGGWANYGEFLEGVCITWVRVHLKVEDKPACPPLASFLMHAAAVVVEERRLNLARLWGDWEHWRSARQAESEQHAAEMEQMVPAERAAQ